MGLAVREPIEMKQIGEVPLLISVTITLDAQGQLHSFYMSTHIELRCLLLDWSSLSDRIQLMNGSLTEMPEEASSPAVNQSAAASTQQQPEQLPNSTADTARASPLDTLLGHDSACGQMFSDSDSDLFSELDSTTLFEVSDNPFADPAEAAKAAKAALAAKAAPEKIAPVSAKKAAPAVKAAAKKAAPAVKAAAAASSPGADSQPAAAPVVKQAAVVAAVKKPARSAALSALLGDDGEDDDLFGSPTGDLFSEESLNSTFAVSNNPFGADAWG